MEKEIDALKKAHDAYAWGLANKDQFPPPYSSDGSIHLSKRLEYSLNYFVRNRWGNWQIQNVTSFDPKIALPALAGLNGLPQNFVALPENIDSAGIIAKQVIDKTVARIRRRFESRLEFQKQEIEKWSLAVDKTFDEMFSEFD